MNEFRGGQVDNASESRYRNTESGLYQESPSDYHQSKQAALRLLAFRPRAVEELRRKLKERFSEAAVELTLTGLLTQGLLDDAAFAREWRRQRELHRPRDSRVIGNELRQLGIDSELVQEALADYDAEENSYRAAARYAHRIASLVNEDRFPEFRRKLWAFLQRRGFESSVVRHTVDRLWGELFDPSHRHIDGNSEKN